MAAVKEVIGSTTSLTVTNLQSLSSSLTAGWQSDVVDNTSDLFLDIMVAVTLSIGSVTPANDKGVYVYAYGAWSGSNYTTVATGPTGTQGTFTFPDQSLYPSPYPFLGFIPTPIITSATTYRKSFSLAAAFQGSVPLKWGILIRNYSGNSLASSANAVDWTPIHYSVT